MYIVNELPIQFIVVLCIFYIDWLIISIQIEDLVNFLIIID